MSVRYKFKSEATFSQILFDGIFISAGEVRQEIFKQRRLGKKEDIELMMSNAETGEKYTENHTLIPKNTSLIVIRVPATFSTTSSRSKKYFGEPTPVASKKTPQEPQKLPKIPSDLASMEATEEEKIMAMMMQSTVDYRSFLAPKQQLQPPSTYVCRRCQVPGHYIRNCPLGGAKVTKSGVLRERRAVTRMTGIPMSMRNQQQQQQQQQPQNQVLSVTVHVADVPKALRCSICSDIYRNPSTTPCCSATFCNECVVRRLTESDEYECPQCAQKFVFPSDLVANSSAKSEVDVLRRGRWVARGVCC